MDFLFDNFVSNSTAAAAAKANGGGASVPSSSTPIFNPYLSGIYIHDDELNIYVLYMWFTLSSIYS